MSIQIKKILVGVDNSDDAKLAFSYAIDLAKVNDANLVITSILENDHMNVYQVLDDDYVHDQRQALDKQVLEYRQQALDAGVKDVQTIVAEGSNVGETIIEEVMPTINPDTLVIGAKSKKGIARHFGSQAAYMAKYSPVTITVVR